MTSSPTSPATVRRARSGVAGFATGAAVTVALAASPLAASAQLDIPTRLTPSSASLPVMEQADSLYYRDPVQSVQLLELVLAREPGTYQAQWRAARAAVSMGIIEEEPQAELAWVERAADHAEIALALDSTDVEGLYWLAVSKGLLALHYGPKTSSDLAQEVWDLAHHLLAIDPEHPGAHNMLGKLNQEVMSLSKWQRVVARFVLRTEPLRESSWDKALDHHRRAVAAEPGTLLFHLDLGRTLDLLGRDDEARAVYSAALALPDRYPVDPTFRKRIQGYLDDLGSEG